MDAFADILIERYGFDVPLLTEDIVGLFPDRSRQTVFRWINEALEGGTLARFSRGVYYLPRATRFGRSKLLPEQVVRRRWIEENGEVIGYVSGSGLANSAGITEQVPATLEVTTNKETTRVREVPAFGGWKSITLRRPRKPVTKENVQALRFLDIITNEPIANMSSRALKALRSLARKAGREQVYSCAAYYPSRTAKQLIECERSHVFA